MTSVEDELQRLRDEIQLLNSAARDDERDLKALRVALEEAEMRASKAEKRAADEARRVEHARQELYQVSQLRFEAQTQVKQLAPRAGAVPELEQERALLVKQADADTARIRELERELNQTAHERDRALERAAAAESACEEAVGQCEVLERHAAELRASNSKLAERLEHAESLIASLESEGIGGWFVRNGRADQRKLAELREKQQQQQQEPPSGDSTAHRRDVTSHASGVSTAPGRAGPSTSLQTSGAERSYGETQPRQQQYEFAKGRFDDISGEVLGGSLMTATGMSCHNPGTHGADRSSSPCTPRSTSAQQQQQQQSTAGGGSFATIRSLRQQRQQLSAESSADVTPTRTASRIEAIYGEKGSAEARMYLVKFRAAAEEEWVPAADVEQCPALSQWRAAKAEERRGRANLDR